MPPSGNQGEEGLVGEVDKGEPLQKGSQGRDAQGERIQGAPRKEPGQSQAGKEEPLAQLGEGLWALQGARQ